MLGRRRLLLADGPGRLPEVLRVKVVLVVVVVEGGQRKVVPVGPVVVPGRDTAAVAGEEEVGLGLLLHCCSHGGLRVRLRSVESVSFPRDLCAEHDCSTASDDSGEIGSGRFVRTRSQAVPEVDGGGVTPTASRATTRK